MFGFILAAMPDQETLIEMPAGESRAVATERPGLDPKLKAVDRNQFRMLTLDVDTLVAADHKVRAIWELTGSLDLSRFLVGIRSQVGVAGREHTDPRLLVAVWLYAYSESISSARKASRQMEHEPGFRWLTGLEVINHTTLSDFRRGHKESLDELFTELLAVLEAAGEVDLEQVMHDGTKIQAQASPSSFRREKSLRQSMDNARRVVEALGDPDDEQKQSRRDAARQRAAREKAGVLEQALAELEEIRKSKRTVKEKAEARVSMTEPEARFMKHGNDGGIAPSYNVQITTDAKGKVIVGFDVNQCSSDASVSLLEVVNHIENNLGGRPSQMVVDGAYTGHDNIVELARAGVDLIGPLPDSKQRQAAARKASGIAEEYAGDRFARTPDGEGLTCPLGQRLDLVRINVKRENTYAVYQAPGSICSQCDGHVLCCPKGFEKGRSVSVLIEEAKDVVAFRTKMATDSAKQAYRKRSEVAETPNAWIKEKIGIRKFRLRGLEKIGMEILWACVTYNVMQWIRLVWRKGKAEMLQPA
jgi:transposase